MVPYKMSLHVLQIQFELVVRVKVNHSKGLPKLEKVIGPWNPKATMSLLQSQRGQEDKSGMSSFGKTRDSHQQLFCWSHSGCLGPLTQLGMGKTQHGQGRAEDTEGQVGGLLAMRQWSSDTSFLCMMLTRACFSPNALILGLLGWRVPGRELMSPAKAVRNTWAMASLFYPHCLALIEVPRVSKTRSACPPTEAHPRNRAT